MQCKLSVKFSYGAVDRLAIDRAKDAGQRTAVDAQMAMTDDGAYDMNPTWSPDGQSIVYSHYDGTLQPTPSELNTLVSLPKTGWSLVKVDVATGQGAVLTTPADSPTWRPVYSPDGQHIDFIGWKYRLPNVFQTTPSGEPVTPLLITPFLKVTALDWK